MNLHLPVLLVGGAFQYTPLIIWNAGPEDVWMCREHEDVWYQHQVGRLCLLWIFCGMLAISTDLPSTTKILRSHGNHEGGPWDLERKTMEKRINCSQHPFNHPSHTYVFFWGWLRCRLEEWPSFSRLKTLLSWIHDSMQFSKKQRIITQVAMYMYIHLAYLSLALFP